MLLHYNYVYKFEYKLIFLTLYSDIRNYFFYFCDKSASLFFYNKSKKNTFIIKVKHFYDKS